MEKGGGELAVVFRRNCDKFSGSGHISRGDVPSKHRRYGRLAIFGVEEGEGGWGVG